MRFRSHIGVLLLLLAISPAAAGEPIDLQGHQGGVLGAAFFPDGKRAATAGEDGTLRLWESAKGEPQGVLKGHEGKVFAVAISPDGERLASGGWDKTVRIWDAASQKLIKTVKENSSYQQAIAFSPDGKTIASGTFEGSVRLRSAETGEFKSVLVEFSNGVKSVAFFPDGEALASGGISLKLWNLASNKMTLDSSDSGVVRAIAISGDGRSMACAEGNRISIRDASGARKSRLTGHQEMVTALAFTGDGAALVSGSEDKTIRIWDLKQGKQLRSMTVDSAVNALAIAPDDQTLLVATNRSAKLWRLEPLLKATGE